MTMFSKLRGKNKKQEKEEEARAAECRQAIEGVLRSYNCELKPVLFTTPHGILPDIHIYPLPIPKNEPGQHNAPAGAVANTFTSGASTAPPEGPSPAPKDGQSTAN